MTARPDLYEVAKNILNAKPVRWREYFDALKRAAAGGHPLAQEALGLWFLEGCKDGSGRVVLARSPARGAALLLESARSGNSGAFFPLGTCFDFGEGVQRSDEEALYWYRRAARHGDATAALNASTIYRDRGDRRGERRWLTRAKELGDSDAVLRLARIVLQSPRAGAEARRAAVRSLRALARSSDAAADDAALELRIFARARKA